MTKGTHTIQSYATALPVTFTLYPHWTPNTQEKQVCLGFIRGSAFESRQTSPHVHNSLPSTPSAIGLTNTWLFLVSIGKLTGTSCSAHSLLEFVSRSPFNNADNPYLPTARKLEICQHCLHLLISMLDWSSPHEYMHCMQTSKFPGTPQQERWKV